MTSVKPADAVDYFISYNRANRQWAEWIAETLEANHYTTILQAWDFRPGNNFILKMQDAPRRAKRILLVLSPDSLNSDFVGSEWASFFAEDPSGNNRRLISVRVEECDPTGLLRAAIYIDLVGLDSVAATAELLGGLAEGRRKP